MSTPMMMATRTPQPANCGVFLLTFLLNCPRMSLQSTNAAQSNPMIECGSLTMCQLNYRPPLF